MRLSSGVVALSLLLAVGTESGCKSGGPPAAPGYQDITSSEASDLLAKAEFCRELVSERLAMDLAYDEASIGKLDEATERLSTDGRVDSAKLIDLFGGFYGESLRQIFKSRWVKTEHGFGVFIGEFVAHPFISMKVHFDDPHGYPVSRHFKEAKFAHKSTVSRKPPTP
jgi:hypothetical protein